MQTGDRMEANDLAFHQRVQSGFAALAAQHSHIKRIDANQPLRAGHCKQVIHTLEQCLSTMVSQPFEQLLGQPQAVTLLTRAIACDRIAPAYLFVGPAGIGRTLSREGISQAI